MSSESGTGAAAVDVQRRSLLDRLRVDIYAVWPIAVMILIIIATALRSSRYLTVFNFENILSQIAPLGIVTMG